MDIRTWKLSLSSVIKYLTLGTGAVALSYAVYRWSKRRQQDRNISVQLETLGTLLHQGDLVIVNNDDDWPQALQRLQADLSMFKVLGLDSEWVPGNNPTALLQLATRSGLVILIRLCSVTTVPQQLKSILSDKGILKLGVGIFGDATKLRDSHGLCVRGCVDLRHLAARQRKVRVRKFGLSSLCEAFLGFRLVKVKSVTCSDWASETLTQQQIQYAAADALVAVRIFEKLLEIKNAISVNDGSSEKVIWQKALSLCQGIVDVKYNRDLYNRIETEIKHMSPAHHSKNKTSGRAYSQRKKPIYDNCHLQAPDGQLLCTCDSKKAEWYVMKGLGKKIGDNPVTIELLFEPSGRPQSEKNYYLQDKDNVCVVCGSTERHNKKSIVPHEYRKYFPSVMKEHRSHDVLPLCAECHQTSSLHDNELKQYYANKCDAPMVTEKGIKFHLNQDLKTVCSAARALLKSSTNIPEKRRQELEKVLCDYFGVPEVNNKLLMDAAEIDPKVPNGQFIPHGEKVVNFVMSHEGLLEFERTWRQHFLDTMKPQYLHEGWSVDHSHNELQDLNEGMSSVLSFNQNGTL